MGLCQSICGVQPLYKHTSRQLQG
uniref:UDP-galactopyranose mutase n=1 Tax=Streptococcus suis TaxID=1307 RepID=A0A0F6UY70_STRSU|nr:UDP-galactopyranose mutase [Streptococcus suis]